MQRMGKNAEKLLYNKGLFTVAQQCEGGRKYRRKHVKCWRALLKIYCAAESRACDAHRTVVRLRFLARPSAARYDFRGVLDTNN
jgi:hypothetical protein